MLPSKIRPTTSLSRLTTGLPELPPMMSAVDTKLSGVSRSSLPADLRLVPARGELIRRLVAVGLGMLEGPADRGERRDRLAVDLVALDDAEGQSEREGRVGIDRVALRPRRGPWRSGRSSTASTPSTWSSCILRTARASASTASASLIIGSSDASIAALPPSASFRRTATSASFESPDELPRRPLRASARARTCSTSGSSGICFFQSARRLGELGLLEFGIDRGRREELQLERLERRVAVFLEPLGIRLGASPRPAARGGGRS